MKNCAIVGINWGDEGKGRMVDLLTEKYDVVVRYQGGGNWKRLFPFFPIWVYRRYKDRCRKDKKAII